MSLQNNLLMEIMKSKRTVFNIQALTMMLDVTNEKQLIDTLYYYTKRGDIRRLRKGIYSKATYDERELACMVFRPSYLSLDYVLQRSGIIFQYDSSLTMVSYLNRSIEIDGKTINFRKIKPELWFTADGIIKEDNIWTASPERAFLDTMYLSTGQCCFDNLHPLNKSKIKKLLPSYQSAILNKRVVSLLDL